MRHQRTDIGEVTLEFGCDLLSRPPELVGKICVECSEARAAAFNLLPEIGQLALQTFRMLVCRCQITYETAELLLKYLNPLARGRSTPPSRRRQRHPAVTAPAGPASGSVFSASGASGWGIVRMTFAGLPATIV